MKIKTIKKFEDDSRIVNVNFVTSMIENSQVAIGMKYFVVEFFSKQRMSYEVNTALDEEELVKELSDCTYGMDAWKFQGLINDIINETPKFCYVYDNPWKYVLIKRYKLKKTVDAIEEGIRKDINAYHNCKLYDLLEKDDKRWFENVHPIKLVNSEYDDKMILSEDYKVLYSILWDWFNGLTKGKYELVDETLYNKVKKAEDKMSTLKYKELNEDDLAEVYKFVQSQVKEKGWYYNTGEIEVATADGRKLVIAEADTLDLAIGLTDDVRIVGDYILNIRFKAENLFKGANEFNPVDSVYIDSWFRKALKLVDYDENRFYEWTSPYGRLGYNTFDVGHRYAYRGASTRIYVTKVNEKSIQFAPIDGEFDIKCTTNEEWLEKRRLDTERKDGKEYESFNYFGWKIEPKNTTMFTPEALLNETSNNAVNYYKEAVEKFGEPIVEQEVTEQELVAAAPAEQ